MIAFVRVELVVKLSSFLDQSFNPFGRSLLASLEKLIRVCLLLAPSIIP
jgi:hypothetical protein